VIKKSINDINKERYTSRDKVKYLGVFETTKKLTHPKHLFNESINDLGLHIHLFVSVPTWFTYEVVRYQIVDNIDEYILNTRKECSLLVGNEKSEYFDTKNFIKYHSKQFWNRDKGFILTNI